MGQCCSAAGVQEPHPFAERVFEQYALTEPGELTAAELQKFLADQQDSIANLSSMTLKDALATLICAEGNSCLNPKPRHFDMSQPLCSYFINSSHNTYLSGNQLTSDCKSESITCALRQGCRVVELDCYDERHAGEGPVVTHGGTLTRSIPFRNCVEAIRDSAFTASPYPVIITLENHCHEKGQSQIATLLRDLLGDVLYRPPWAPGMPTQWPSPEELKGRILIRDKPPKQSDDHAELTCHADVTLNDTTIEGDSTALQTPPKSPGEPVKHVPIGSQELLQLVSITNVSFKGFDVAAASETCSSSSFSENKFGKIFHKAGEGKLRAYANQHIARVFPGGQRVDSSNYDPSQAWFCGVQVAALNFQGNDRPLWLNHGKFRANGGAGYILKPPAVRLKDDMAANAMVQTPSEIRVRILGGLGWEEFKDFDYVGAPDTYVTLEIAGTSVKAKKQHTSVYSAASSHGPEAQPWFDESFTLAVHDMDLEVLLFVVLDQDTDSDDLMAQFALPVADIRPGWRRVPLHKPNGDYLPETFLICHISFG
mmetsp:Transcript_31531/g.102742  ORF Transcript_31531/g.102742 Transcript_31531/m.102742 type:complete len:540 (-) Transcript_31531:61-1680(-)